MHYITPFARQLLLLLFLPLTLAGYSQQFNSKVDSLIHILPEQTGTKRFNCFHYIVAIYDQEYDTRAIPYADEGYEYFLTMKNPSEDIWTKASNFPYAQAGFALHREDYTTALKKCDILSEHAAKMEDLGYNADFIKCNADFYRAIIYQKQEKSEQALKSALNAISHFENPDTVVWAIPVFSFIGNRYGDLKKFATANRYFAKSINFYEYIVTNGIKDKKLDSPQTQRYHKTSLARAYFNRGIMFIRHQLLEQALSDFENAVKYTSGSDNYLETKALISLCEVYGELGRNREAYDILDKIEYKIDERIDETTRLYYHETLSKVTANLGIYDEAFNSLKIATAIQDTFDVAKHDRDLAELQTKYETKEQQNEIVQLQTDNATKQHQNKLLLLLLGGLSLIGGFIFFQSQQKKKYEDKITNKEKEVLELKENFFINITHQLRTPLSLIIAPLKEVQSSNIDTKSKLKVDQALKNSDRLLELFNQLLDWNKMESHALKLSVKKADITESLQSLFDRYQELAKEKNITFTNELPEAPIYGEMDFDKLEKILSNLISNAIKFTPTDGRVLVRSHLKNDKLYIEVEDNGIGIKAGDIDKVFEKYYQVGDGSNGFGFGLTFANELTKLMGGNLSARSTASVKTVFELTLPFTKLKTLPTTIQTAQKVAPRKNPITTESSLSLLIVEDNIELNNYLTTFFESQYTIISALTKKEALELAYEHAPDIILCDVMLPDGNGFEILKELKNNTSTSHIPILMLTAKADEKSRKEGWDTGADGYLTKPFDPTEVNAVIHNLLVNRQKVQTRFGELSEAFIDNKTPEIQDPFMENLLTLMNDNISNEYYSIDDLAANFPMNRTHFYQKVKALSGSTPKKLFREMRLKKARNYITSGITAKEAALKTGFVSLSHFSRSYKTFFKENPSETFQGKREK